MPSSVDICNIALTLLGAERIMALDEASERAALCKLVYPEVRDNVLRCARWGSATFQAELALSSMSPIYGYTYRYVLPTDPLCLRVWEVEGGEPFRRVGRELETDVAGAKITYTAQITDMNVLDPSLRGAIARAVAAHLAFRLTGQSELVDYWTQNAMAAIYEAKIIDGLEGVEAQPEEEIPWLEARGGGS